MLSNRYARTMNWLVDFMSKINEAWEKIRWY
jgi:hypothetical protein